MISFGFSPSSFRALAHVGGGLADVADSLGFGEDDLAVGVFDEVPGRADRLPALLAAVEDRGNGEADRGQDDRRAGEPADSLGGDREGTCGGSSTRPRSSREGRALPAPARQPPRPRS